MRGHGEGTITKRVRRRKDGREIERWQAAITLENGKRAFRYASTYKDAQVALRQMHHAREQNQPANPAAETVDAFFQTWLASKLSLAPRTRAGYSQLVRLYVLPEFGRRRLKNITSLDIQRLISRLAEDRPSTAQHVRAVLKGAFGFAATVGLIPSNPVDQVEKPKHHPRPIEAMDFEQAQAVLSAFADHPLKAFITFMLNTGARPSEALAVTWNRIDVARGTVTIDRSLPIGGQVPIPTKTARSNRTLPLWRSTLAALDGLPRGIGNRPVFNAGNGNYLDERILLRTVRRHLKRFGLAPMTLYQLRHGAATLRMLNGDSLKVISEQLGHSTITTTADRYLHVTEGQLRESADRLEKALRTH
jgi:integrase